MRYYQVNTTCSFVVIVNASIAVNLVPVKLGLQNRSCTISLQSPVLKRM